MIVMAIMTPASQREGEKGTGFCRKEEIERGVLVEMGTEFSIMVTMETGTESDLESGLMELDLMTGADKWSNVGERRGSFLSADLNLI